MKELGKTEVVNSKRVITLVTGKFDQGRKMA